ncbi:MAG: hypothetical protein AAF799_14380 [Myxococcota bacterium]
MADPDEHPAKPSGSAQVAEDLVDAATGLDGRAWQTLRDLVLRPWTMIQRAAFDHDPRYVSAVKLSLAMSTLSIVLMSWLVPSEAYFDRLRVSSPEAWAQLTAQLDAHGVCFPHFADRFSSRHELLNTIATLFECGVFGLFLYVLDRARPYLSHLNFVLYCYSLWLLATAPLQFVVVADLGGSGFLAGVGMIVLLPGLMLMGLRRLYPAPWLRQVVRGSMLLVLTAVLLGATVVMISSGAMAWTRASFGL